MGTIQGFCGRSQASVDLRGRRLFAHGDAQRRGDEPLICSEFGVWGLPHPREIVDKDGSEPWWFESGHDWNPRRGSGSRSRADVLRVIHFLDGLAQANEIVCDAAGSLAESEPKLGSRHGADQGRARLGATPATIALTGPGSDSIAVLPLELQARDAEGGLLSRNALEFCVVPSLQATALSLFPMDDQAAGTLAAIGWPNRAAAAEDAEIMLATCLTTPARESLIAGRKVVLIANADDALVDPERKLPLDDRHNFPQMLLRARDGTPWDGQWMGAFAWRRTDGAWANLPNGPMLDEHWSGLLPHHVLIGFPSTAFHGLVDSGMVVGWLHLVSAFAKRSFLGEGRLTVTTFDLTSAQAAANPLAPHLLAALTAQ